MTTQDPKDLTAWGRMVRPGIEVSSTDLARVGATVELGRGLGRSYGDSSLPATPRSRVLSTLSSDRILAFDESTGDITVEAGFSLADLARLFLPRGWFTPVSPGTKFVTVGGMVASDIHGKNHHVRGCFGEAVQAMTLCLADGRILRCSRTEEPDLFRATLGGMGLTGLILDVTFRLERVPSPWIWQQSERVSGIGEFLTRLADTAAEWPMTVGWIDCVSGGKNLGRGLLMCGRWATAEEAPTAPPPVKKTFRMPFDLPSFLLNRWTVRVFNALYFRRHPRRMRTGIVHPDSFFYPLDAIHDWNRLYGKRGLTQYQCVIPREAGTDAVVRFMDLLVEQGAASPLCVIKDCGPEGTGLLSFPRPGVSIAVDMPVRDNTQAVVDRLNEFLIDVGGRIYLTKDGYTRREHFEAMEAERLPAFHAARDRWDPERRLRSAMSVRLFGDPVGPATTTGAGR
ncbi:MAG: FAD-binding oxidoreductase [Myxococcales bacterium]|nr:FAD-binding oxidoreductase [Myxococcales bacterium]